MTFVTGAEATGAFIDLITAIILIPLIVLLAKKNKQASIIKKLWIYLLACLSIANGVGFFIHFIVLKEIIKDIIWIGLFIFAFAIVDIFFVISYLNLTKKEKVDKKIFYPLILLSLTCYIASVIILLNTIKDIRLFVVFAGAIGLIGFVFEAISIFYHHVKSAKILFTAFIPQIIGLYIQLTKNIHFTLLVEFDHNGIYHLMLLFTVIIFYFVAKINIKEWENKKMIIFAHRGFSSKYPENTMEAFKRAYDYKIDGIETDVQLSKDNVPMICHDERLDRTTDHTGLLRDYTCAELQKINANYHHEGFYPIPTLAELLDFLATKDGLINLELKTSVWEYPGIEKLVYEEIHKRHLEERIIISSFNHESLVRIKEFDPNIKCGILTSNRIVNVGEYMVENHFEFHHPSFHEAHPELLSHEHELGLKANVWTVDDEEIFKQLEKDGADGIITNCVDKFCEKNA